MRLTHLATIITLALLIEPCDAQPPVRWWLTTHDLSYTLAEQNPPTVETVAGSPSPGADQIVLEDAQRYQTILGLGSSLDHATCFNLSRLPADQRLEVIARLFDRERGIGINLSRICIGTPDFTNEPWYTYDDVPPGEQDPQMERFSIEKDRRYVLPILKQAQSANPELLFFASPWSPPGWMKSTGDLIGGHLRPEHYEAYARYLVRFIQEYAAEGIPLHAITIQNEPGVDRSQDAPRWRYPSCRWTGEQERDFIKSHFGPALAKAGLPTEIWTYDHNYNVTPTADGDDPGLDYPRTVLRDLEAAKFVRGVAFHGYAGKAEGMSVFHEEFPATPIHFTEGSVFGPAGGRTLVEYLRNWASSYNGWVTMLDSQGKPNNGPFRASRTCVTLDHRTAQVAYHYDYYQYGHFFRFLQRGGWRIESSGGDKTLGSVAVQNPNGDIALVTVNSGREPRNVQIVWRERKLSLPLPGRSIATLTWKGQGK
jgi:glucosylceramidase